jgi:Arabinose efflux permease
MNVQRKITILIAGILMMLCTGILYLWSIFQPHVAAYHGWSIAQTSITSSIMIFCFVLGNITAGLVQEKVRPKTIGLTGAVLFPLGLFLTSIIGSGTPLMIYLTYGLIGGFGCGLVYSIVLAVLQKWYASRMGLITGIIVGSFGLSTVIMSPVVETLITRTDLPTTFRVLAISFFVILVASAMIFENPRVSYFYSEVTKIMALENAKQFHPRQMLKSASFYYIFISIFTSSAAYMVIVPFISTIAIARGLSSTLVLVSVMCTGAANSLGRILAPTISDKIGRTKTIMICSVISALACVLIIYAQGLAYVAAVFLIALSFGGIGGTNPVLSTELFGARHSGINYGLILLGLAFASVLFGQMAASMSGSGDFTIAFIICAILCAFPIVAMMLLRIRVKKLGKEI